MGLTNQPFNASSPQITILLREMLGLFADFMKLAENPKQFQKLVMEANQLSADQEAKSRQALDYIGQASKLKAELEARENHAKKQLSDAHDHLRRAQEMHSANASKAKQLSDHEHSLSQKAVIHKDTETRHAKERAALDSRFAELDRKKSEIDEKSNNLAQLEKSLTEKAEKLRRAAEGL